MARPEPATSVIDPSGVIRWAHAGDDYTERTDAAEVIAAVGRYVLVIQAR